MITDCFLIMRKLSFELENDARVGADECVPPAILTLLGYTGLGCHCTANGTENVRIREASGGDGLHAEMRASRLLSGVSSSSVGRR